MNDTNGTQPLVSDAVRELERELRAQGSRRWFKRLGVIGVLAAIVGGLVVWRRATRPKPPPLFTTAKVERRDIVEKVESTGTVNPVTEVQVGAQVSGRIVSVKVDYNSKVKKGDLLAVIDPSLFGAQVSQARAQLKAAEASLVRSKAQLQTNQIVLARQKNLLKENLTAQSQVDQAQGNYDVARANVSAAQAEITQIEAQLKSARTTLAYTRIYSPINGVVITRNVDPGQTVAASFAAPVLFVIAQDLSKMQVLADIDEADVGKLKKGMKADVVVDAFPGETFHGKVTQVRYSPNTVQGVVTYSAVIDVDNPQLKLRPGMTATVTIRTREAHQVLAVRNAALRFRPIVKKDKQKASVVDPPTQALEPGQARLFLPAGGPPEHEKSKPLVVEVGITDGLWTELKGGPLKVGDPVIVEERETKKKGFNPF